jgi:hypothetical protein
VADTNGDLLISLRVSIVSRWRYIAHYFSFGIGFDQWVAEEAINLVSNYNPFCLLIAMNTSKILRFRLSRIYNNLLKKASAVLELDGKSWFG